MWFSLLAALLHSCVAADTMCNSFKATQHTFSSMFSQVHWVAPDNDIAFVETMDYGIYRSDDGGATWIDQADLLVDFHELHEPHLLSGVARVHGTSDPKTWYLNGFGTALWKTTNAGASYDYMPTKEPIHSLAVHPTISNTLLGQSSSARCFNETAPGICVERLFISDDGGYDWRFVLDYVFPGEFAWGHSISATQAAAIWAIDWSEKSGELYDKDEFDLRLVSSTDEFASPSKVELDHAVDFLVDWNDKFMLAAVLRDDGTDQLQLYSSPDVGKHFFKANFPSDLEEQFYTWMDHSEGVVFVHVREHYNADYGNVYVSDSQATDFTLSLDYVSVRSRQVEFRRLSLLDGVFFANVKYAPEDASDPRTVTVMSHDKGSTWHSIPPKRIVDINAPDTPLTCTHVSGVDTHGCFFHFGVAVKSNFRDQRSRGAFHSSPHAPGVALAVGNIGSWYEPPYALNDEAHGTFLTRDAGVSWTRLKNGSHIGAIGDQGSLIVLGDDNEHTREIHYSHDGGATWNTCDFLTNPLDEEILINNIIIEPSTSGTNVLIFGSVVSFGYAEGRVVHIAFSKYSRECAAADYEKWEVFKGLDASFEHCFLGAKTVYDRRKPTAECHAKEFQRPTKTPCTCAPIDYECDFCYEKIGEGLCGRVYSDECPQVLPQPSECDNPETTNYLRSRGYRPIPGNKCTPGLPGYERISTVCSGSPGVISSGSAWTAVVVILLIVLLITVGGCVAFRKNQQFERFVRQLRIPGVRGNQAHVASAFADDDMDDDLLGDTGGYESN